jgi:FKBP-type peptidyl-prolyl cis-trans isomerase FkpA
LLFNRRTIVKSNFMLYIFASLWNRPRHYLWLKLRNQKRMSLTPGPVDSQEIALPGMIDPGANENFLVTDSGLKYRILRTGSGAKPKASSRVTVHYKGWLDDGSIFDSSYRRDETISFGLNQVIKGWTEGMQLVGVGGMIELEIPYALGYGERGSPGAIPPRATLHFIVELFDMK